ncbi:MAG TPA: cupredoxin domain-containing protein [Gemmatimonadales bacterium]|nr:cupredoxin domain-containing protein [Gemmatimonadales bacterium]
MSADQLLVIVAGLAAIAWINWYFFLAERRTVRAAATAGGAQEVRIAVRGGYDPGTVRVEQGRPVRLVFDRQETSSCSEEVVLPAFGIRRFLPAHEQTVVELTPREAGSFEFTCGMGMLRGKLEVDPADPTTAPKAGA